MQPLDSVVAAKLVMPGQKREARLRARCPGHPRLDEGCSKKDVDGRDKPGHDEKVVREAVGAIAQRIAPSRAHQWRNTLRYSALRTLNRGMTSNAERRAG